MNLSELIAKYGDDKVQFQNLDQCADTLDYSAKKGRTMVKFGTEQPIGPNGTEKLGLVVWFDRKRVAEIIAQSKATARTKPTEKIYLAARYSRFPEMQSYRTELEALGFEITSRWINGGHELTKEGSTEAHEAERVRYAQEDFADLLSADCVVSFTEIPRETKTRGGRHVEHGMALALGKRVVVVGYRENVFHCLPQVEFFPAWIEAKSALKEATRHAE